MSNPADNAQDGGTALPPELAQLLLLKEILAELKALRVELRALAVNLTGRG